MQSKYYVFNIIIYVVPKLLKSKCTMSMKIRDARLVLHMTVTKSECNLLFFCYMFFYKNLIHKSIQAEIDSKFKCIFEHAQAESKSRKNWFKNI